MNLIKDLDSSFERLSEENQKRIEYVNRLDQCEVGKEIIITILFKVLETEIKKRIFFDMIKRDEGSDTQICNGYNENVLKVIKEENGPERNRWDKRNEKLCSYLLSSDDCDHFLDYQTITRSLRYKRKWHEIILYNNFENHEELFYFEPNNENKSDFIKKLNKINTSRNIAVHNMNLEEGEKFDHSISDIIWLINKLHKHIK